MKQDIKISCSNSQLKLKGIFRTKENLEYGSYEYKLLSWVFDNNFLNNNII